VYGVLNSLPVTEEHPTNPRCAYGVSKLAIEKYLILHRDLWGLDSVSLRISNAYGPRQEVIPQFGAISTFAARALRGEPITIFGDGSIIRDYVYIDDLVEAMILAGKFRHGPPVMNVGSGAGKSLNDIVTALSGVLGRQIAVNYVAKRDFDVPVSVLDISLARATLDWMPRVPFEAGIASTLRAIQSGRGIDYDEDDAARL